MAINPIAFTEKVVSSFLKYQLTAYPFADERLNRQMRELLNLDKVRHTPLMKGPYVSLSQTFRQGATIAQLVKDELLHPAIQSLAPYTHVYGHQENAIRKITAGQTTLVSTGTGSGKSECFLYPAISKALQLRDETAPAGISTVIVYPMNALAEDQLNRLRHLLAGSGVTFGMYVGKTPDKEAEVTGYRMPQGSSNADYEAVFEQYRAEKRSDTIHPPEEVCSRELMRTPGCQPRILLTNVKQLELLLTRGTDASLFANARLDYLVFDEAHTFNGMMGAESACLVRRLKAFCDTDRAVCIATSATIYDERDPEASQIFASRFFGVEKDRVACVREEHQSEAWHPSSKTPKGPSKPDELLRQAISAIEMPDPDAVMRAIYKGLCSETLPVGNWSEQLYDAFLGNRMANEIRLLLSKPKRLDLLTEELKELVRREVAEEEVITYLLLGAAAMRDNRAVFRPVVHGFIRGISGAVITFENGGDPRLWLSGEDEEKSRGTGDEQFFPLNLHTCTTCGQHYFIHWVKDFDFSAREPTGGQAAQDGRSYWETMTENNKGARVILVDRTIYQDDDNELDDNEKMSAVYFCRHCGVLHSADGSCCVCGRPSPLVRLYAVQTKADSRGSLSSCVSCKARGRPMGSRYREPMREVRAVHVSDVHILAQDIIQHVDRKRLLLFTDSRQDAAFQAGWMKDHARRFRLRRMIAEVLAKGGIAVGDLVCELEDAFNKDDQLSRALLTEVWLYASREAAPKKHYEERKIYLKIQVLREIALGLRQRTGLEPWGRLIVDYLPLDPQSDFVQEWSRRLGIPSDLLVQGIASLMDNYRRQRFLFDRELELNNTFFDHGDPWIQRGYMPKPQGLRGLKFKREAGDEDKYISYLFAGGRGRLNQILKKWNLEDRQAQETFAENFWTYLLKTQLLVPATLKGYRGNPLPGCSGTYQIDTTKLRLRENHGYYQCDRCGYKNLRAAPFDKCLAFNCEGKLVFVREPPDSYDLQLLDQGYAMLRPEEHTAMVPHATRERIENQFRSEKDNSINTLVCTPTLELGVDIGGLDCTLMRNVPPLPANYWQRVGRAGRRNRMAVNVTYCRPLSHDAAYYAEPEKMLEGRVDPPSFNMRNEIMLSKHVNAAILTRLHQLSRSPELPEPTRESIHAALKKSFPTFITSYLFDAAGNILKRPVDCLELRGVLTRHQTELSSYIQRVFRSTWPIEDAQVVLPEKLDLLIKQAPDTLDEIARRLFRRLQWAYKETIRLNKIRSEQGTLDEIDEAHYRRCDAFIKKMKGQARRHRRDAQGVDDINTFNVLAIEGFLPGYGLETGSIRGTAEMPPAFGKELLELPRPNALALREYVPGNLVYANSQKFIPRHYLIQAGEELVNIPSFLVDIKNEAIVEVAPQATGEGDTPCLKAMQICDVELVHQSQISDEEENRFQLPVMVYGKEQDRNSGGDVYQWGERLIQLISGQHFRMVNAGTTASRSATQTLGYPVCKTCGQSVSPLSSKLQIDAFLESHQQRCGKRPEYIGFYADVVADCIKIADCKDRIEAYSVIETLRIAATQVLDMYVDDLQVLVIGRIGDGSVNAYLWDPMPGGSGLLKEMLRHFDRIHEAAIQLLENCIGECQDSCICCLQTFRNSFYHKHLNRFSALEFFHLHGDKAPFSHPMPAVQAVHESTGKDTPSNQSEEILQRLLERAGLGANRWQLQLKFKRTVDLGGQICSTTPDVYYESPEEGEQGLCIYLDGLSEGIHGNAAAQMTDKAIRNQLRIDGYEVVEITVHELSDKNAMIQHFKRIAKFLDGRTFARDIESNPTWFTNKAYFS